VSLNSSPQTLHDSMVTQELYIDIHKVKVKFALVQARKAQRESRNVALFFL
jgi:tmRNA-binding protein